MDAPRFICVNCSRRLLFGVVLLLGTALSVWAGIHADDIHQWLAANGSMASCLQPPVEVE
jgi:hypothetical protein